MFLRNYTSSHERSNKSRVIDVAHVGHLIASAAQTSRTHVWCADRRLKLHRMSPRRSQSHPLSRLSMLTVVLSGGRFQRRFLLTYSMVQSPSWAANWFTSSQEIPRISRNPKVHYRTNKRPPTVSILGPPNPVHIPTSHLLEIHPNIIHPSTPIQRRFYPL